MKKLISGILLYATIACYAIEPELKFYGDTEYSKGSTESLVLGLNMEYRIGLYETKNQSHMFYIGGTIDNDYDHFGRIIKTLCFTNFGIEF
jgi:hypothetical protein